jgi:magnesium chelatase subunit D
LPSPDSKTSTGRTCELFPFGSIVGLDESKRALLLLAVEPRLRGALILGVAGSGKTTLGRAFAHVLSKNDGRISTVESPINATEDRLLGGIDLERTIESGRPVASKGLLVQADGGVLFVDEANLLEPAAAGIIAAVLDRQSVNLQREGLSSEEPARFTFVGTYDPAEGQVDPAILDRVGLVIETPRFMSRGELTEMMEIRLAFDSEPRGFVDRQTPQEASLISSITRARALLPEVRVPTDQLGVLARTALSLGVIGNRADIFAACAARASAALDGRTEVAESDLVVAVKHVLLPRATVIPTGNEAPKSELEPPDFDGRVAEASRPGEEIAGGNSRSEDLLLAAMDADVDIESAGRRLGEGSPSRRRSMAQSGTKGRQYRDGPKPTSARRIAIASTIRAAAPHQLANGSDRVGAKGHLGLRVRPDDLRYKQLRRRSGPLFIFVVDASGSMAANRMGQAKGAMLRLLSRAYLHRDKVAMIHFRRSDAQVLLEPTRSVELARRLVDALPVGGATPVSAGLFRALAMARQSRLRGMHDVAILLFTDGRANVSLRNGPIEEELRRLGRLLAEEKVRVIVVDTRPRFVQSREATELAATLRAEYVYLSKDAHSLSDAIARGVEFPD